MSKLQKSGHQPLDRKLQEAIGATIDETIELWGDQSNLSHLPHSLSFPPVIEQYFEQTTGPARSRSIALLCSSAMLLSYLLLYCDYIFTPQLFSIAAWVRALPAIPALLVLLLGSRASARPREFALFFFGLTACFVQDILAALPHQPLSAHTFYVSSVATICVIIVFPLRFMYAVVFAVLRTLSVVLVAVAFSHPSFPQMVASAFILVVPLPFLLIANYRSEKATRTAWLLATRETLRVFALESERSQLLTVANIDGLTGISNRGYFNRKIAAWSRTRSSSRLQARLILLDVDFFKRFNDTYGHLEGDHCLRSIARVIGESIRGRDDFAFRYGGEEFGVLLFNITDDEALHAAERLCGRVEDLAIPHLRRGDGVSVVTVSSGVSRGFLPSEQAVQLMIADADRALYAAKSAGRNRVHPAFPAIACPSAE